MTDDDLRLLAAAGTESSLPAGHVLIERGQPGSGLFLLLEGAVVVEAPEGTRNLGAGSVIGERALLSTAGERTARVSAATDVRVVAVERDAFDRLCADDPGLAGRIADAGV